MTYRGLLVTVDGISEIAVDVAHFVSDIHDAIDGRFEVVRCVNLPRGILMLVDEEGMLKNLPLNVIASRLYGGAICGTALIMRECITEDGERDIIGLSNYDFNRVLRSIHNVMFRGGHD